ncbi:glycoside hydrolase family 36 protein [Photobacterium nomapromontoriensis]|uniref:glycoside hydrolase family 36 protein n=1 Tax=Photobacterium nomapromontoriensis TaxID=2910237 RepID=UPI003D0E2BB4
MIQTVMLENGCTVACLQPNVSYEINRNELALRFHTNNNSSLPACFPIATISYAIDPNARLIGDGFQMLAQTAGTVNQLVDIGRCPDNNDSYRLYPQDAPKRFYNYLVIEHTDGYTLFGFTTCHRFAGYFEIATAAADTAIHAYLDGENSPTQYWETDQLENVCIITGDSLANVYGQYAKLIQAHHPRRLGVTQNAPVGWCSWYAYYANVTEQNIKQNVAEMHGDLNDLEWVLLDDGYQAFMGDWLTPSDKFAGGVKELIHAIKTQGKKPAIWMAPFIAQPESQIFKQHPEWFVKHNDGTLLKAEDITYGGWRCTPWYILDTSHPEVQAHLTHVVKTMREDWGVELFKLDANYWGTLKGERYQPGVTGVQAYRMGMEAIAAGSGDAWLLGCNAPMWPSLGLVDAMRVSDDVERQPQRFEQIAKENFYRSWQHRQLWQIDPDCVTLTSLPDQATDAASYAFHRTAMLACGGLLLSGDPLPEITPFAKASFTQLIARQKLNQQTATFSSLDLSHAQLPLTENSELHCLFNFNHDHQVFTLTAKQPVHWYDYWSGEKLTQSPSTHFDVTFESDLEATTPQTASAPYLQARAIVC